MTYIRKIKNSVKPLMMLFSKAPPAGARHDRFLNRERAKLAKEAFDETRKSGLLGQEKGPGDIILSYLLIRRERRRKSTKQEDGLALTSTNYNQLK